MPKRGSNLTLNLTNTIRKPRNTKKNASNHQCHPFLILWRWTCLFTIDNRNFYTTPKIGISINSKLYWTLPFGWMKKTLHLECVGVGMNKHTSIHWSDVNKVWHMRKQKQYNWKKQQQQRPSCKLTMNADRKWVVKIHRHPYWILSFNSCCEFLVHHGKSSKSNQRKPISMEHGQPHANQFCDTKISRGGLCHLDMLLHGTNYL